MTLYIITLSVYFLFLIGVGATQRRMVKDASDYFRSGGQGEWWMVGASTFMTGISAYTFTAASGVAFDAGWSVIIIYLAGSLALYGNIIIGPWFRQLRAITTPEVIRMRFNPTTQQFVAWLTIFKVTIFSALPLYALALFCSAIFGFNLYVVILGIGLVVLVYSMIGGKWAVLSCDFVQGCMLCIVTVVVFALSLAKIGGFSGLFGGIDDAGLGEQFQILKPSASAELGKYTATWSIAILINAVISSNTLQVANRFFCVKDGASARKAAILSGTLQLLGSAIWFVPPIVARLLYAGDVDSMPFPAPAEAAYAVMSLEVLPPSLMPLMVVGMFAATMSSLDSGLNGNAAIFTKDIYPLFCRLFSITPLEGAKLLMLARVFTLGMGMIIISIAVLFASMPNLGIFDLMLLVIALLGLPLALPLLLCLFIKRVPQWSAIASTLCGIAASAIMLGYEKASGEVIIFQHKVFINTLVTCGAFMGSGFWWRHESDAYREKVDQFFALMKRPIDAAKELGEDTGAAQLLTMGRLLMVLSALILLLLIVPQSMGDRLILLLVALCILLLGIGMVLSIRKKAGKPA